MDKKNLDEFERKVLRGLELCGITLENPDAVNLKNPLGAAVSGGADSVSLLVSLSSLMEKFGKKNCLEAITVNHGIREKSQTDGDAIYVENLCKKLGVHCTTVAFAQKKVAQEAEKRGKGIEEAAREMRYNAFFNFLKEKNLVALCVAHNKNDQIETVLMRFLNGSGSEGLGGIPRVRKIPGAEGKIVRPLLEISRAEIESYLLVKKINWRTDSTNSDNHYLRNRIRNELVPFLDKNFAGWKNSVLTAAEKCADDSLFIQKSAQEILENHLECKGGESGQAEIDAEVFFNAEKSVRRRIVFSALNKIGFGGRFPFTLAAEICSWKAFEKKSLSFENLEISLCCGKLKFAGKSAGERKTVSSGANFIFTCKDDFFEFENLKFFVEEKDKKTFLRVENSCAEKENCLALPSVVEVSLPFFAGSAAPGEKIMAAGGHLKKIADIFSDWKVPARIRNLVPVVRKISGGIEAVAVLGSVFGFEDWKVKAGS